MSDEVLPTRGKPKSNLRFVAARAAINRSVAGVSSPVDRGPRWRACEFKKLRLEFDEKSRHCRWNDARAAPLLVTQWPRDDYAFVFEHLNKIQSKWARLPPKEFGYVPPAFPDEPHAAPVRKVSDSRR